MTTISNDYCIKDENKVSIFQGSKNMLAKRHQKNQITLPKEIVKDFPDIEFFDGVVNVNKIVLSPVRIAPMEATLAGIRKKIEKLGITQDDMSDAVKWARNQNQEPAAGGPKQNCLPYRRSQKSRFVS